MVCPSAVRYPPISRKLATPESCVGSSANARSRGAIASDITAAARKNLDRVMRVFLFIRPTDERAEGSNRIRGVKPAVLPPLLVHQTLTDDALYSENRGCSGGPNSIRAGDPLSCPSR